MKKLFFIFFVLINGVHFGQQKSFKQFETTLINLEINTEGLDQIIIENSNNNFISIHLNEENPNAHHIFSTEENGVLKIGFQTVLQPKKKIFRKFITERLNRASVKIMLPKHKNLTFLGDEIDIISSNYQGNISIFIDKGTLKLSDLKGNLQLHLFSGNVFLNTSEGKIDIKSNNGRIEVDNKFMSTPFIKLDENSSRKVTVKSINANITLTTKKPQ